MKLTPQEQAILGLLRADPLLDAAALAERLGSTRASVSVALSNLTRKGAILGRGYVVRPQARSVVVVGGTARYLRRDAHAPLRGVRGQFEQRAVRAKKTTVWPAHEHAHQDDAPDHKEAGKDT